MPLPTLSLLIGNLIDERLGKATGKKLIDPSLVSSSNIEFNVSSASPNTAAQPLHGMPLNFYENEPLLPKTHSTPPMTSHLASSRVSGLAPQG
jgi:hypothetical protein